MTEVYVSNSHDSCAFSDNSCAESRVKAKSLPWCRCWFKLVKTLLMEDLTSHWIISERFLQGNMDLLEKTKIWIICEILTKGNRKI